MTAIHLRPIDPERDFGQLAELFTNEQDEPTTEPELMIDYQQHKERIIRLMAAENELEELMGFNWVTISRFASSEAYFYIIVKPEQRGQGAGRLLYEDMLQAVTAAGVEKLQVSVRDTCPECRSFVGHRGFIVRSHQIGMTLNLVTFNDKLYDEVIARLKDEGFLFTSMEALGNTEAAQRKLYALNDSTSSETMGTSGEHSWLSFADFQEKVCRASWYIPAGQMVVIDTSNDTWAAMSAITRFKGADYAYNLFTGVDRNYRERKLGQAVKVIALRYARDVLQVTTVRTNHNSKNSPMLAIDHKLGYVQSPGSFQMEKELD